MRIQQACHVCGLTRKAILYYEKQGLVRPALLDNGYRDFSPDDVEQLRQIALLRSLGLSLEQIRMALEGPEGLKEAARQLHMESDRAQERLGLLDTLAANGNYDQAQQRLEALESKDSIRSRLLACFPGSYGQYLSLHFGGFLNEPITTPAQQAAFDTVIAFLDGVDFSLPQDLQDMLDAAAQAMDAAFVSRQDALMRQLAADPARYIDDHRQALDDYMDYVRSDEYRTSPAYRLRQALTDFTLQSGYRDVFLPAMRQLSPSYDGYCRSLDRANAFFLARYPDAEKVLAP